MPETERALLASLPDKRREIALRRLRAITEVNASTADRVRIAGGKPAGYFKLKRAWQEKKTLAVLAPYATAEKRRPLPNEQARQVVRDKLEKQSWPSIEALAKALVPETGLGITTLRRIVGEVRRECARTGANLVEHFGRSFSLDYSTLAIAVEDQETSQWADGAFVIEDFTGLLVGYALGTADQVSSTMTQACRHARDVALLVGITAPAWDRKQPELRAVLPIQAGDSQAWDRLKLGLLDTTGTSGLAKGPGRFASFLAPAVGLKVGDVGLLPRATGDIETRRLAQEEESRVKVRSITEAEAYLALNVEAHNAPIWERLDREGLTGAEPASAAPLVALLMMVAPNDLNHG